MKKLVEKTKNGENVPSIQVVEVVLVQCNLGSNQYQQKSEISGSEFGKENSFAKKKLTVAGKTACHRLKIVWVL